ncbi:MAG: peroxidase-related enzyme [Dehalococcoidia bacterium]|nr:peroxidase-related enzyme [Dehalococcoidia bacterium]
MSRVKLVEVEDADGKAREVFGDIQQSFGMVPNLFKAYALRPEILEAKWNKVKAVMQEGELPPQLKQMIAVVVSKANECQYCVNAHSAALAMMGMSQQQIQQLVENLEAANISASDMLVLKLAVKSTLDPRSITDQEMHDLKSVGYSDSQVVEVFSVAAMFTALNKFIDTLQIPIDFPAP